MADGVWHAMSRAAAHSTAACAHRSAEVSVRQAAVAAQPRDPHFLDALAKLDEMAQGIARDSGASCTDLRVAAHMSTPSGPAREAAERALSRCR